MSLELKSCSTLIRLAATDEVPLVDCPDGGGGGGVPLWDELFTAKLLRRAAKRLPAWPLMLDVLVLVDVDDACAFADVWLLLASLVSDL